MAKKIIKRIGTKKLWYSGHIWVFFECTNVCPPVWIHKTNKKQLHSMSHISSFCFCRCVGVGVCHSPARGCFSYFDIPNCAVSPSYARAVDWITVTATATVEPGQAQWGDSGELVRNNPERSARNSWVHLSWAWFTPLPLKLAAFVCLFLQHLL